MVNAFPLPDGWAVSERVEDEIAVGPLRIRRAGIAAVREEEEACGSAAATDGSPSDRAFYELLERITVFDAQRTAPSSFDAFDDDHARRATLLRPEAFPVSDVPERWRYARTNGVAIHRTWGEACRRARLELIERDRFLRAWYGAIAPTRLERMLAQLLVVDAFEWGLYSFPDEHDATSVVAVFGFPRAPDAPLVMGMAAREDLEAAVVAAEQEALQQLAFLWGEPVGSEPPPLGPTAMHHLELYQPRSQHEQLRAFLAGAHRAFGREDASMRRGVLDVSYLDLTPEQLRGLAHVSKAISAEAVPLIFGDSPFAAHLPAALRPHPIG